MANGYRKRSSTSATGVKRTTTQKQGGGVKTTTSQSSGSSSRLSFTRNSNGSVVQTTTRKTGDGYVIRQSKTLVPKYKPVKYPKQPKMPNMKTSVVKEKKERPRAAPKVRQPRAKKVNFNWFAPTKSRPKRTTQTVRSNTQEKGLFAGLFGLVKVVFFIMIALAVLGGIFGD